MVPYELYRTLTAGPPKTELEESKQKMHDILEDRHLDDSTKNILYNQELMNYLKQRKEILERPQRVEIVRQARNPYTPHAPQLEAAYPAEGHIPDRIPTVPPGVPPAGPGFVPPPGYAPPPGFVPPPPGYVPPHADAPRYRRRERTPPPARGRRRRHDPDAGDDSPPRHRRRSHTSPPPPHEEPHAPRSPLRRSRSRPRRRRQDRRARTVSPTFVFTSRDAPPAHEDSDDGTLTPPRSRSPVRARDGEEPMEQNFIPAPREVQRDIDERIDEMSSELYEMVMKKRVQLGVDMYGKILNPNTTRPYTGADKLTAKHAIMAFLGSNKYRQHSPGFGHFRNRIITDNAINRKMNQFLTDLNHMKTRGDIGGPTTSRRAQRGKGGSRRCASQQNGRFFYKPELWRCF